MVRIAGVQFIGHADKAANIEIAERMVRQAAARGARIACLPELFNTMYFCVETKPEYFDWAEPVPGPTTERMGALARELGIVLIAPVFEKAPDGRYFNCAAVLGPDGRVIGKYRKSSIPFMDASQSSSPAVTRSSTSPRGPRLPHLRHAVRPHRHPDLLRPPLPRGRASARPRRAEIVFVPTATTRMTRYLWDVELRAHAIANVYYVCGVNKVGVDVGAPSATTTATA